MQPQGGFRLARVVVEPLVGVQHGVAVEPIGIAVVGVSAGPCGQDDVGAAVTAQLGGGIQSYNTELLDVVGGETLDVALRVGHSGLVGVNAVNGNVVRSVAGAEHVRVRTCAVGGALHDARFQR